MSQEKNQPPERSYEEVIAENEQLWQENERLLNEKARLGRWVEELKKELEQLRGALEEARRWQKRPAAPFSRGEPKANPKRPGRPTGHPAAHRERPRRIDRVIPVPLGMETCPRCGHRLSEPRIHTQYQVDIPRVEPIVTQFDIEVAHCLGCGGRVQGRAAEQTSDALGAAAVPSGRHQQSRRTGVAPGGDQPQAVGGQSE